MGDPLFLRSALEAPADLDVPLELTTRINNILAQSLPLCGASEVFANDFLQKLTTRTNAQSFCGALVSSAKEVARELTARTNNILARPPCDAFWGMGRSPRLRSLREWLQNPALYALAASAYGLLLEHDRATAVHSLEVAELLTHFHPVSQQNLRLAALYYVGGLLHDLGKLVIPAATLNSRQPLTGEERDLFRLHPEIGAFIVLHTTKKLAGCFGGNPRDLDSLLFVADAALFHHANRDGTGYPNIATERMTFYHDTLKLWDTVHAMMFRRAYRTPLSPEEACAELRQARGSALSALCADDGCALIESGQVEGFMIGLRTRPDKFAGPKVVAFKPAANDPYYNRINSTRAPLQQPLRQHLCF